MNECLRAAFERMLAKGDEAEDVRPVLEEAIRSYPQWSMGRPGWTYGLDDLDYGDFVPELANWLAMALEGSSNG